MGLKRIGKGLLFMFSQFSLTTKIVLIVVIFLLGWVFISNNSILKTSRSNGGAGLPDDVKDSAVKWIMNDAGCNQVSNYYLHTNQKKYLIECKNVSVISYRNVGLDDASRANGVTERWCTNVSLINKYAPDQDWAGISKSVSVFRKNGLLYTGVGHFCDY